MNRAERQFEGDRPDDHRNAFQRDRDRILYTTHLRRLAGTTQVAASNEGHVFHNRLTHTMEVAQIAKRLAERLWMRQPELAEKLQVSPDVAEAAAWAHDLGHPPFGHNGERVLDEALLELAPGSDGFEGNAQTFRILTRLSIRHHEQPGLNLTRATLNATLKYPWLRAKSGPRREKFGAYWADRGAFEWARVGVPGDHRTVEAEIMDIADDIAYSVHDLFDFFRAGLIPMHRIVTSTVEFGAFVDGVKAHYAAKGEEFPLNDQELDEVYDEVFAPFPLEVEFDGSQAQRGRLRSYASQMISRYVTWTVRLTDPGTTGGRTVWIDPKHEKELFMLKQLTAHFVIRRESLRAIQHGQARVLRDSLEVLLDDARLARPRLLPDWARHDLDRGEPPERVVADIVSGLTEAQAYRLHERLTGRAPGSLLDAIL
jgi:dGTPase